MNEEDVWSLESVTWPEPPGRALEKMLKGKEANAQMFAVTPLATGHLSFIHKAILLAGTWDPPRAPSAGSIFTHSVFSSGIEFTRMHELNMIYADTPKDITCKHLSMQTTRTLANFGTALHLGLRAVIQRHIPTQVSYRVNFLACSTLLWRETRLKETLF